MDSYQRDTERRLVAQIVDAMAERRRGALGLDDRLWAGTVAAIVTAARWSTWPAKPQP